MAEDLKKRPIGEEKLIVVLRPLPWYPNESGWHFGVDRRVLRKDNELKEFHKYLVAENEQVPILCEISPFLPSHKTHIFL